MQISAVLRCVVLGVFALVIAGCASVEKVDSGERLLGNRLSLTLAGAWNQIKLNGSGIEQIWSMEGLDIDQLIIYPGLKEGEEVKAASFARPSEPPRTIPKFRAGMQPDEIVRLFEVMFTRDGSSFKLVKLEPVNFARRKGFRFEYAYTRRKDGAQLLGLGYAAVDRGELFAMVYFAPRLTFFPRHRAMVDRLANGAALKA